MAATVVNNPVDSDGSEKVPVVLRVKRKRTDDPAESLVVKKLRRLDSSLGQNGDRSSVFHLVGTFPKHDISDTGVLDHIKSHKSVDHSLLVKKNPFSALTISEKQDDRREKKKVSSQSHRFKIVSQRRQLEDSADVKDGGPTPVDGSGGADDSAKDLMSELVHLYDVVKEDSTLESKTADEDKRKGSKSDSSKEVSGRRSRGEEGMEGVGRRGAEKTEGAVKTEGAITCNSAEMVREKQPISRSSNGTEGDYVYDLYFTRDYEGRPTPDAYDWDSLCVHDGRYDIELFNYDLLHPTSFTAYDEEDDSNDEDNWRNDYPDEEDIFQSDSDEDGLHSRTAYRYRDSYDDYIFDAREDPYQDNTSYWINAQDDEEDPLSRW